MIVEPNKYVHKKHSHIRCNIYEERMVELPMGHFCCLIQMIDTKTGDFREIMIMPDDVDWFKFGKHFKRFANA